MADSNQLKVADLSSFGDDDPFAELTKIMGFDPRVPVRPKSEEKPVLAPVKAVAPAVAPDDAAVERVAAPQPRPTQAMVEQPADDFSIDLEKELLGGFDADEPQFAVAPQQSVAAPQAVAHPVAEPVASVPVEDAEVDFDAGFAAGLNDELVLDDQVPAFEEPLLDDEALALEYDEEADVLPAESAPVAYEQPAYRAEAAPVDPAQEEIDLDFDLAMAEVDMDFGTDDNEPAPVFDAPIDVPERSFESERYDRNYEPAAAAPVAASYVPAQPSAAPYAAAPSYASPSYASPSYAASSYAAPVSPVSSYAAEPEELSLEDELNALLGNRVAPAVLTAEYDHTPIQPASASDHADWGSYDDEALRPVAEDDRFSAPADAEPAEDLEFDDGAFAAAFENSLVNATPAAAAADEQDPFAYLQDMGAKAAPAADTVGLYRNQSTPSAASYAATPLPSAAAPAYRETPATRQRFADDMPDVETVDIPEAAVAFADDLDIPELAYEDDAPAAAPYDDFDSDFAGAFGETVQQQDEPARAAPVQASLQGGYDPRQPEPRYDAAAYAAPQPAAPQYDFDADDGYAPAAAGGVRGSEDFRDFDYDEDLEEEIAIPAYQETRRAVPRNGMLIAAVVGGVALLGGIGAFALSFGDSSTSDVPAVVKADDGPIKVRPENPGGTVVPNQENKVFETMAGKTGGAAPAQEKLITTAEEPVDMAARSAEPVAPAADETAKAEDRIDPATAGSENADSMEVAAVAPRKVKTMVVRADGTLVPREEPAPVSAEAVGEPAGVDAKPLAPATDEPALAPGATAGDETGSTFTLPGTEPVTVAPETTATAAAPAAEMPAAMPVAPSRPADQPVDVVGEVKADKVAAVANAAPTGAYAMQIASQPTEAGAQETYQDLARRYASVIGGRDASIVKAEIPGKGTFWRVRIAASSRNEAVSLCESYKSAGGNCFVSK